MIEDIKKKKMMRDGLVLLFVIFLVRLVELSETNNGYYIYHYVCKAGNTMTLVFINDYCQAIPASLLFTYFCSSQTTLGNYI